MVWNNLIQKVTLLLIICFLTPLVQANDVKISRTAFSTAIERHEPINRLNTIQHANQKIYFFTEVRNAHGKKITHQWLHNDWVTQSVTLSIKSNKWRTYSSKSFHPGTPKGTWTTRVLDENGNLLTENAIDYLGKAAINNQPIALKESKTLADKIKRKPAEQKTVKKNEPKKKSQPETVKPKVSQKSTKAEKTVSSSKKEAKKPEKTAKNPNQKSSAKKSEPVKKETKTTEKTNKATEIKQQAKEHEPTKKSSVKTAMVEDITSEEDCDAEDDASADDQIVSGLEKNLIK